MATNIKETTMKNSKISRTIYKGEDLHQERERRYSELMLSCDKISKNCVELSLAGIAVCWLFLHEVSICNPIYLKFSISLFVLDVFVDFLWAVIYFGIYYYYLNPERILKDKNDKEYIKDIPSIWGNGSKFVFFIRLSLLVLGYMLIVFALFF